MKVMLIEDEQQVRELAAEALTDLGFNVVSLDSGENVICHLNDHRPDVLLLDQRLPGRSGVDCLRELRADPRYQKLPVIMLTGLDSENDVVLALESGADDYVTKPFLARELAARIRAVTRRAGADVTPGPERMSFEDLVIDFGAHRVAKAGREISLTLTEFRLLAELVRHPDHVLSRDRLRRTALANEDVTDRTIDVHLAAVRKKLGAFSLIQTVRGIGYRFSPHDVKSFG